MLSLDKHDKPVIASGPERLLEMFQFANLYLSQTMVYFFIHG